MATKLGTAAWGDLGPIAYRQRGRADRYFIGRLDDGSQFGYADDRHVLLVSGTRGGKGTTSIVPNICNWPGSLVVIDPKGENATIAAARRGPGSEHCEGWKQSVHVLDPFRTAQVPDSLRASYNPLDALDPDDDEVVDEAAHLADALVVVNREAKDPFWDGTARDIVKLLILHVVTSPNFDGRRNLIEVRRLIQMGYAVGRQGLLDAGEPHDRLPSAHELLWTSVSLNQKFGGVIAQEAHAILSMVMKTPKVYESVMQSARRNTEFLDSPAMRRTMEHSSFALADLKKNPDGASVFLCLPERYMGSHFRWLRAMITLTLKEMERIPKRPQVPVLLLMDEFAALERMQIIEQKVAKIAGHGVRMVFVLQTLAQLKDIYQDNWETFVGCTGLKVLFSVEDHFTREYASKLIGETEISRTVANRSEQKGTSTSEAAGETLGGSETWGTSDSVTRTKGQSSNSRETQSSESVARQSGENYSRGTNWSNNRTTTTGQSSSQGSGTSETLHVRPLVSPDEVGRSFGRLDDPTDTRYPGQALVLIAGEQPAAVRRVNYFSDPMFIGTFDPHPDHPTPKRFFHGVRVRDLRALCQVPPELTLSQPAVRHRSSVWGSTRAVDLEAYGAPFTGVCAGVPGRLYHGDAFPLQGGRGLSELCARLPDKHLFWVESYEQFCWAKDIYQDIFTYLQGRRDGWFAEASKRRHAVKSHRRDQLQVIAAGISICALALVPGLPVAPILIAGGALAGKGLVYSRRARAALSEAESFSDLVRRADAARLELQAEPRRCGTPRSVPPRALPDGTRNVLPRGDVRFYGS